MSQQPVDDNKLPASQSEATAESRRPVLRRFGRLAAVTAPTIALLLAAKTKPAKAVTSLTPL